MKIAYITPYQGPSLLKQRPIVRNRSLSNTVKIELIAKLLHSRSHTVEILSHGEVVEHQWKFYPSFCEPDLFHRDILVHYISALPIRRLNGLWSSIGMLRLLKERHRACPFDLVIIFNLKRPQIACANYAIRHLRLPVILEYEDDAFLNVLGEPSRGFGTRYHRTAFAKVLNTVSGCIAVSPHLLSQLPSGIPKLLLRGFVGDDIVLAGKQENARKINRVLFAGTHTKSNGIDQLITAWKEMGLSDWELHVTGYGDMTETLHEMAKGSPGIVFHGLVSRPELIDLMRSAKICINPCAPSQTPGNVFAFKIIEYLAAGAHVITTPMGTLEPDIETGITYMKDNSPQTIAATLSEVIRNSRFKATAEDAVRQRYGAPAVSEAVELLIREVVNDSAKRCAP